MCINYTSALRACCMLHIVSVCVYVSFIQAAQSVLVSTDIVEEVLCLTVDELSSTFSVVVVVVAFIGLGLLMYCRYSHSHDEMNYRSKSNEQG